MGTIPLRFPVIPLTSQWSLYVTIIHPCIAVPSLPMISLLNLVTYIGYDMFMGSSYGGFRKWGCPEIINFLGWFSMK